MKIEHVHRSLKNFSDRMWRNAHCTFSMTQDIQKHLISSFVKYVSSIIKYTSDIPCKLYDFSDSARSTIIVCRVPHERYAEAR
jgi:hypothetical protein